MIVSQYLIRDKDEGNSKPAIFLLNVKGICKMRVTNGRVLLLMFMILREEVVSIFTLIVSRTQRIITFIAED